MMTVKQVSELTGVSIRTLQYYDKIGLLHPDGHTDSGYRLYDSEALLRLQEILLFRELEIPLRDIMDIVNSPDHDKQKALRQHIGLLEIKKQHIEGLISIAENLIENEVKKLELSAFNTKKIDEYTEQARAQWGETPEYREFSEKDRTRSAEQKDEISKGMMDIFVRLGQLKDSDAGDAQVQKLIKELQDYISENYYKCSDMILASLGKLYGCGGDFTENIDKAAGEGTACFASRAIEIYAGKK